MKQGVLLLALVLLVGCGPHRPQTLMAIAIPEFAHEYRLQAGDPRLLDWGEVPDTHGALAEILARQHVSASLTFTNPAHNGMCFPLNSVGGEPVVHILYRTDANPHLVAARRAHELYHALCRIAPQELPRLHRQIARAGYPIDFSRLDEEMGATLIELLVLQRRGGYAWEDLNGSPSVEQALDIIAQARRQFTNDPKN